MREEVLTQIPILYNPASNSRHNKSNILHVISYLHFQMFVLEGNKVISELPGLKIRK